MPCSSAGGADDGAGAWKANAGAMALIAQSVIPSEMSFAEYLIFSPKSGHPFGLQLPRELALLM
jgi:hypothetical protein